MTDHHPGFDPSIPAASRRYNFLLRGKDNFQVDRSSAATLLKILPQLPVAVMENRKFVLRVVRYLTEVVGIRQFLDIGAGMPLPKSVHEVAQELAPDARVVYVDNDQLVGVHTRALCLSSRQGRVAFLDGDLLNPDAILQSKLLRANLDLTKPVAVLLCAILHFEPDDAAAYGAVSRLIDALALGSAIVITHATFDPLSRVPVADLAHGRFRARTAAEVAKFLDGLDLVAPGLVSTIHWHPDLEPMADFAVSEADAICYAVVARKP
jgi:S-adenosyl methyltransferase